MPEPAATPGTCRTRPRRAPRPGRRRSDAASVVRDSMKRPRREHGRDASLAAATSPTSSPSCASCSPPLFVWLLLHDGGQTASLRYVAAGAVHRRDRDRQRRRAPRPRPQPRHRPSAIILDPIADKMLTGAALVMLSILGELPWWVTIVILVRELGITAFRFAVLSQPRHPRLAGRQAQDRRAGRGDLARCSCRCGRCSGDWVHVGQLRSLMAHRRGAHRLHRHRVPRGRPGGRTARG